MTKQKAVQQLISNFENKMIAQHWQYMTESDIEICKALKIRVPKDLQHLLR